MNQFGALFRKFRLQKGYQLNQTAADIVSPQFLRRFEKDQNDITITKFFALLQRINVSVKEFMFEYNEAVQLVSVRRLEEIIDEIIIKKDEESWRNWLVQTQSAAGILGDARKEANYFIALILMDYGNRLFHKNFDFDMTPLWQYLESVETWGEFEFLLATYSCHSMSKEVRSFLWQQSAKKKIKALTTRRYSQDFYLHICLHALLDQEVQQAKEIITTYESFQQPEKIMQNLSHATMNRIINGLVMALENKVEGEEICREMVYFFRHQLGYEQYAQGTERYINLILETSRQ
ncbi:helix-turn-helix domain-containing protein [Enterococcus sp. LJL120]